MSSKKVLLVAVTIILVSVLFFYPWRRIDFKKISDGSNINSAWKASVARITQPEGSPEPIVYSIKNTSGKSVELEKLEFEDLYFSYFQKNGKDYLLTRYYGSGTSEAYYYSLYQLSDSAAEPVYASEYRTADGNGGAPCLETLEIQKPDKPTKVFGSCGDPQISRDTLIFEMPGWHCGYFEEGGCPSKTTVWFN